MVDPTLKRKALGEFLRTARSKITPSEAGLPTFGRRRTPGLRREEVAQLAGISVTWYTWIEQAREVQVSPHVWSNLADALYLNRAERAYLFELAGVADPDANKAKLGSLPQHLDRVVLGYNAPCYIIDKDWNMLYFNDQLNDLFGKWPSQQEMPNLLDFIFFEPRSKDIVVNWPERARRVVAEFRADTVSYIGEDNIHANVQRLLQGSEDFKQFWQRQMVEAREGGVREFNHPTQGYCEFEQITFRLATQLEYKLVLLMSLSGPDSKCA